MINTLTIGCGHHAGVALWRGDELTDLISEEKFTNVKTHWGFPHFGVKHMLQVAGGQIHKVVVVGKQHQPMELSAHNPIMSISRIGLLHRVYNAVQRNSITRYPATWLRDALWERVSKKVRPMIAETVEKCTGVPAGSVQFLEHHDVHAESPFSFYQIDPSLDVLSITADGEGDEVCSKIFIYRAGRHFSPTLIAESHWDNTAGSLIGYATRYLGMRALEHEYKVMGLAAWVKPERLPKELMEALRKLLWIDQKSLQICSSLGMYDIQPWFKKHAYEVRFDVLAAAIQTHLEDLFMTLVRASIKKTGVPNLAFSGGLFLNVKMNQKIVKLPEVKRAWFMPGSGDESLPIGAKCGRVPSIYTGIQYTGDEIRSVLEGEKLPFVFHADIEVKVARLLAAGQVVGRFAGRGEWGPRALGNRSILAHPGRYESFFTVNDQIKCRDFWMPFAATILEEDAGNYLADWDRLGEVCPETLRYMSICANCTDRAKTDLMAAYHHGDGTMRPQILREQDNPKYHQLISHFKLLTGIPALLNTSLNVHGYPLVGTLEQAIWTFRNSGLRHLAIENFLLSKNV